MKLMRFEEQGKQTWKSYTLHKAISVKPIPKNGTLLNSQLCLSKEKVQKHTEITAS